MNGVNKKALGNKIRTLRIENHWTMENVATFIGAGSKSTVNSWERGQAVPSDKNLEKLAILFRISRYELINAGKVNYLSRIKELRIERDLTLDEMSKQLGIGRATINNYEVGRSEPNISTLIKLAEYFDVSIDYLVGRSDKR